MPKALKYTGDEKARNCQAVMRYRQTAKGKIVSERAEKKYQKSEKARHKNRKKNLMKNYGLTLEQYDQMFENQGGVCAICEETNISDRRLVVDHNHKTGKIRGLLCYRCNVRVGFMEDKILTSKTKEYLKRTE